MGKQDIIIKVKEIIDGGFDVTEISYVPEIKDPALTFGNKGLSFNAVVLYIDMRGSTSLLNTHNKKTVAKMHMTYFHTIIKVIKPYGGEIRSFNGDSVLVFFSGDTQESVTKAVRAAMVAKYMISNKQGIASYLQKYSPVDFGIGVDYGQILCTKIGEPRISTNQDLIWLGNAVNRATVISDLCHNPNHIGISYSTYEKLPDSLKYISKNKGTFLETKKSIWTDKFFKYNNELSYFYDTSYHIVAT